MNSNPFSNYRDSYYLKDHVQNPNILVGDYSYYAGYHHKEHFEERVWFMDNQDQNCDKLIIGKFCSIGTGVVFIMSGNQGHRYDWISTYPLDDFEPDFDENKSASSKGYLPKGDTVIGHDVWIGAEALIMPGIQVGNGSVIATRSVVTKNIDPYTIVGGNPACFIKKRFTEEEIQILIKTAWWDWDIKKIKRNLNILRSSHIASLLTCK